MRTLPESQDRGALTEGVFYILLALYTPMHGYGIMQFVKELSAGRVNLGPGTLYGAINTLLEKNWIKAVPSSTDSRKKEYEITPIGRQVIHDELERLQTLVQHGFKITGRGL